MPTTTPAVLFVCVHNAGRSQMAAGYLTALAHGAIEVRSAGSIPGDQVNPVAIQAMAEEGIDISNQTPKILTTESVQASTWSSPWAAVTPARSSPASATRTGNWKILQAKASTPSAGSATTSAAVSSTSSPNSSPERCDTHVSTIAAVSRTQTVGAVRLRQEWRQIADGRRPHATHRRQHHRRPFRWHSPRNCLNGLSAQTLLEVGVDITDQTPRQLTDDLIREVDRVIVLGRDAHVEPVDGTPVEIWDTDEPSERGIGGTDRMRLVRDDITRRVEHLAHQLDDQPTVEA